MASHFNATGYGSHPYLKPVLRADEAGKERTFDLFTSLLISIKNDALHPSKSIRKIRILRGAVEKN
jgi:hypothetical protein